MDGINRRTKMHCLHCGEELSFLPHTFKPAFCNAEHGRRYDEACRRLIQAIVDPVDIPLVAKRPVKVASGSKIAA